MVGTTQLTYRELRDRLPTVESMYEFLEDQGWYVPEFQKKGSRTKCWSLDYAWMLIIGQAFKIQRLDVRLPPTNIRKEPKEYYVNEINKICGAVKLSFSKEMAPKQWLKNVLFTLKQDHEVFKKPKTRLEQSVQEVPKK